jgi:hypothetical protein
MTTERSRWLRPLAALAVAGGMTLATSHARAQEESEEGKVSPTGKGIAGGILLGAEVVMIPIAIAGVDAWWPYVVFGAVGAGGGAVGGYFVEQVDPAEPALYMLAGGLALVIPTLVAVLNATAYEPGDEEEEEEGEVPSEGGPAPTVEGGGAVEVEGRARPFIPTAAIGIDPQGRVRPGIPAVVIGPNYSPAEVAKYGVEPGTQVQVPVLSGSF